MSLSPEQFVQLARELRELGATQVSVSADGACSATFAPPAAPVVARHPLERRPDQDEPPKATRAAWRDGVRERLNG